MKAFLALLLLPWSFNASAITVKSDTAHVDITTAKVSHLVGMVDDEMEAKFMVSIYETSGIAGDRVILIDSPGGSVPAGAQIIRRMEQEKASGVRMICVVVGNAHSMAFNILTHCNVRLAIAGSRFLVHKIQSQIEMVLTAVQLRQIADGLDAADAIFRRQNSEAMHISGMVYDVFADKETVWTDEEMYNHKYLQGIIPTVPGL